MAFLNWSSIYPPSSVIGLGLNIYLVQNQDIQSIYAGTYILTRSRVLVLLYIHRYFVDKTFPEFKRDGLASNIFKVHASPKKFLILLNRTICEHFVWFCFDVIKLNWTKICSRRWLFFLFDFCFCFVLDFLFCFYLVLQSKTM